ncbi:MAG: hypothetical protein WCG50_16160 [Rhodoferax sp.]|uniref:hypothetical protein n=1 Tax=Rhodoferax sp. TaxID=50421 RepID=UPI0030184F24
MKIIVVAVAAVLTACGGGGGTPGIPPGTGNSGTPLTVNGIYTASAVTKSYTVTYSVLASGENYGFVSQSGPLGLVHGTATGTGFSIQSINLSCYNFQGSTGGTLTDGGTLSASFGASNSITASMGGSSPGSLVAPQAPYSSLDPRSLYNLPLSLVQLAGTYSGTVYSAGASLGYATPFTGLSINSNDTFSVGLGNCQGNGTLTPAASGMGIYGATISISGASCSLAGQTASGIATPTVSTVNGSGTATSLGLLLQLLISNGIATLALSAGRYSRSN